MLLKLKKYLGTKKQVSSRGRLKDSAGLADYIKVAMGVPSTVSSPADTGPLVVLCAL